jgi:hypothetical protein
MLDMLNTVKSSTKAALSVAQNYQYTEISAWFICKVTGPNNLLKYDHLTIPSTYLKTQLCWTRKLQSILDKKFNVLTMLL